MTSRGTDIRQFILRSVSAHPRDLVSFVARRFDISRQAAGRHVRELVASGQIEATGERKERQYELAVLAQHVIRLPLAGLQEHLVWTDEIRGKLPELPQNLIRVWNYGCSEMINNAVDHSAGEQMTVIIRVTAIGTEVSVLDDGVGIFKKIKEECGLEDERHAVLELAKGKLTTDPENHTGEGIFFTSRMMDQFAILSGEVFFSHEFGEDEDWILKREKPQTGTHVVMLLDNDSQRTPEEVFGRFAADEEEYGFNKTVVPVRLALEGSDGLVSRSQAKRLMARLDRFSTVVLDFTGVETIGRAFADEIFRVFARTHNGILLVPVHANPEVIGMITAVRSGQPEQSS